MIELLLMLLKENGNVLRNIFKIILLLNSVIYVTFYTCSNQNDIYHLHVLFYFFIMTLLQTILFQWFLDFFKLSIAVGFLCAFKIFENKLFTSLA